VVRPSQLTTAVVGVGPGRAAEAVGVVRAAMAALPTAVAVCDSKDQAGPVLVFASAAWASFVGAARTTRPDAH
jgi:hypothetical protein